MTATVKSTAVKSPAMEASAPTLPVAAETVAIKVVTSVMPMIIRTTHQISAVVGAPIAIVRPGVGRTVVPLIIRLTAAEHQHGESGSRQQN